MAIRGVVKGAKAAVDATRINARRAGAAKVAAPVAQTAERPFTPPKKVEVTPFSPKPKGFDAAARRQVSDRLEALGATPPADELLQIVAKLPRLGRDAMAMPLARAAERGLAHRLTASQKLDDAALLSVAAEDAGKYLDLLRMTGAPDVLGQVKATEALMHRAMALRHEELSKLGFGPSRGTAISQAEQLVTELQIDAERLRRYGFEAPTIDGEALKQRVFERLARGG